jgi:hypothetical protein
MILSDSLLINKSLLIHLLLLLHSFLYQFSQLLPNATTLLPTILYRLLVLFLFELPLRQPIHSFAMLPYLFNLFLVMRKNGLSFDQPFRGLSPNSNPVAKHQLARPVSLHQVPIGANVPYPLHIAPSEKTDRQIRPRFNLQLFLRTAITQKKQIRLQFSEIALVGQGGARSEAISRSDLQPFTVNVCFYGTPSNRLLICDFSTW